MPFAAFQVWLDYRLVDNQFAVDRDDMHKLLVWLQSKHLILERVAVHQLLSNYGWLPPLDQGYVLGKAIHESQLGHH